MWGGDVFRREIDGVSYHYEVGGLWGSGNTVTERELMPTGENTIYNMWNGEGITGPRTGEFIDKYPALWGTADLGRFVDRYGWLDEECQVWVGEEALSEQCLEVCEYIGGLCGGSTEETCLEKCSRIDDDVAECALDATTFSKAPATPSGTPAKAAVSVKASPKPKALPPKPAPRPKPPKPSPAK